MSKNYAPCPYSYDNPYDYYDACFDREDDFTGRNDVDLDADQDNPRDDFVMTDSELRGAL
jgi:hypothetical protein